MPNPKTFSSLSRGWILAGIAALLVIAVGATALVLVLTRPADRSPARAGAVVAFYGDSYTYGEQASSPDARWSTLLSEQQGWTEVNAGVNGLGYVANRTDDDAVDTVIAADPDLILVTMGLNDTFEAETRIDEIDAAIRSDLERFRTEAPDARIVVVEPFWIPQPASPGFRLVAEATAAAAEDAGLEYIAGAGTWLDGHPEWRADEPYKHPNDAGYAELARRMTAELVALGVIAED